MVDTAPTEGKIGNLGGIDFIHSPQIPDLYPCVRFYVLRQGNLETFVMSRHPQEPTWPFLCILACLFVLSAAAPRAWERTVGSQADATVSVANADAAPAALIDQVDPSTACTDQEEDATLRMIAEALAIEPSEPHAGV